jgi:hypothetical protein
MMTIVRLANLDLIDSFGNCRENGSTLENQVPLVRQVLQPLVQDYIPFPARIQGAMIGATQSSQFGVTVFATHAQHLREASVKVRTNLHVRISQSTISRFEMVRQGQSNRVPRTIKHVDEQLTITRDTRPKAAVKSLEIWYKVQQSKVVALVQSHQTDKTIRPDYGLRYES